MQKKKILVLTDHMPWGHRSIAKAIFNFLKGYEKDNDFEVFYAEVKAEIGVADDLYTFAYRYLPVSNRWAAKVFDIKFARDLMRKSTIFNLPRLKKEVNKINPDLIISAYFFHSHSLADWRKEENKQFKLWTIVADPWTINPISFVKGCDLNIVYDEIGEKLALKYDIKKNEILKTGWWVRPEMYKKIDKKEIRKKLGIKNDRPVIFVGGGSLGTSALPKLLPALIFLKSKVTFVINTGVDKFSYNLVEKYSKILTKLRRDNVVIIKNMGWIDNMVEVLGASDIVFGKAGPNFLFDSVACQKPFVAITHIGGQEDGNIDLIKKKKLGWIKEKSDELVKFLNQYLDDPKYFEKKFKETIKEEALNNEKSLKIILERVKKDLE
ncbi:MAG: glycosyltransferase [Candidatus Shapirobacteria bacterium]|nr:glycosyltransferase [Candidatus Shapirobacteria bacterium]MDD3002822.1 glycosyltransferase [Candidatus Shapirobacteria bacterium]MDD4382764.1 glycosyltransferase [Candidatus Shapirobacteria bacterium]